MTTTRIENGIEWFTITREDGRKDEEYQCARCGSSAEYASCPNCAGDGWLDTDIETDEEWPDPVECSLCDGTGGAMHCLSTPEWCNAHPLPGREQVESTAMSAGAWREVL